LANKTSVNILHAKNPAAKNLNMQSSLYWILGQRAVRIVKFQLERAIDMTDKTTMQFCHWNNWIRQINFERRI